MAPVKQQWTVLGTKSHKTGNTPEYVVTLYSDDTWACACMNWTRNMPREDCKHILRKQKELGIGFAVQPITSGLELVGQETGRKFRK